jgi:tricorn protease
MEDFQHLMTRMIGELNASHLGCYGGGRSGKDTARLGIVPEPSHAGPGILVKETLPTGPCDQPEARIEPGEYILAIDGEEVGNTERVHDLLAGKAGERVKLMVNAEPTMEGAREVSIKPFSSGALSGLWYDLWVEENLERVLQLSDDRVYYIHMNGMNATTLAQFEDELYGPAQRYEAVIIDVRWNGGGYTHDSVIALLDKELHGWHAPRNNPLRSTPWPIFDGPMCCMINQNSFSNAEIFPNGFRATGLGKLIGVPTAGGVIGTWDTTLVNGARFRVPVEGWYTAEGINLENYGVPPDIYVEYPYDMFKQGRDPQLETAVEEMLDALERGEGRATPPDVDEHRMHALP